MLRHHIKLAFRSFRKSRSAFLINLIGLSTGMACALFIYIWVMDELGMDRFHEKDHRMYQVLQNLPLPDEIRTIDATPGLLAQALTEEMPEVKYAAAVVPGNWFSDKGILSAGDKHIKAGGKLVSEDYFRIFSWSIIEGNKEAVLKDKYAVLLSDELAISIAMLTLRFQSVRATLANPVEALLDE